MRTSSNTLAPVLATAMLLSGCAAASLPQSPAGGDATGPVDTASLEALLDAADMHCLLDDVTGCGGTVIVPGGGSFELVVVPYRLCRGRLRRRGPVRGHAPDRGHRFADRPLGQLAGRRGRGCAAGRVQGVECQGREHGVERLAGPRLLRREGPLSSLAVQAVAAGAAEPEAASGSATWTGAMVARPVDSGSGPVWESVMGTAAVTFDFGGNVADVRFTGITDVYGNAWQPLDIEWQGVALSREGVLADAGGTIEGRFFGAGHGEVAGVFRMRDLVGAFAARRTGPERQRSGPVANTPDRPVQKPAFTSSSRRTYFCSISPAMGAK